MTDADPSQTLEYKKQPWSGETMAYLMLRIWIGLRLVMSGLEKFRISNSWIDEQGGAKYVRLNEFWHWDHLEKKAAMIVGGIPKYGGLSQKLAEFYALALGPLMIGVGLALLIGFFNRLSLFAAGMIFISLSVGLMMIGADDGIYKLGVHVALVALAFHFVAHNRLALTKW